MEICRVPWNCGDKDCKSQWHLASYYAADDSDNAYYCDKYGDGDMGESCEESDIPSANDESKAWLDYYAYVAKTGHDPLTEFNYKQPDVNRKWQARIVQRKDNLLVTGLRRRGRGHWLSLNEASTEAKEFLYINEDNCLQDFHSLAELEKGATNCKITIIKNKVALVSYEVNEPRPQWSAKRLKTWLRKRARDTLDEYENHRQRPASLSKSCRCT